ncbi:GAL10 bifunctional protein [Suhomyces tanzawaensis NRRL Y-17324]|uniref:GAL10 bifunctional protein n=1 Tax=Suhomyces tanzawaensis NRRL Y-17324 TaxID=984487 RepID=A0A1E4SJ24_9ASCO|nr:GAL10 bifunctional protein [Suhomyces tanzawaensis NRRL Y-17324]ODV79490.1 GAL10 bifunctional protein [Suhomyces tanzawaensis NRRL Y-17324]
MSEYILVTGGAGYIGSHTVLELLSNGYKVIIVDNLSNSSYDAVARIEFVAKQAIPFFKVDLRDYDQLAVVFQAYKVTGVIHFAALKAVGESSQIPLDYYDNNVNGTITLLRAMKAHNVQTVVFSSSATVYGDVTRFGDNLMIPIPEHCPTDPTNPYGKTKRMIENILEDVYASDKANWTMGILRYFNPMGAHPSGLIGEDPLGIPNNLLPYLSQVAIGRRDKLSVFGSDYDSHDGTPIRDYIHVVDLAKGHISALNYLKKSTSGLYREWNLGTGKGSTVFEIYHAFCKVVGRELPYEVVGRRAGDVLDLTANPSRANEELEWKAELGIDDACSDLWRWTSANPFGFNLDNYSWKIVGDNYENRAHTVENGDLSVTFLNHGAIIQKLSYKGVSVVNGYENPQDYSLKTNPFFGTTVGRVANRIAHGKFSLNGTSYQVTQNEHPNTLHGGLSGYNTRKFLGPVVKEKEGIFTVEFYLKDADSPDGFPGNLDTYVKYKISQDTVEIEYQASLEDGSSVDATIVNLTNHSYFNITPNSTHDNTILKLASNQVLEVDENKIPTGKTITDTRISVNEPLKVTKDINYDTAFVVTKESHSIDTRGHELQQIVEASHPDSKIKLVISSTEPAFQFYTGDYTDTKGFGSRSGFCIEPSRYVDAINSEEWRDQVILKKGEVYGARIAYKIIG